MTTEPKKRRKFTSLFNHSYLDEYGLSASTFRVLANLARRADENDEAWPSISSIVETCKLSRQTVVNSIRELEGFNIIKASRKFGVGTMYTLQADSEWEKPEAKPQKEKQTRTQKKPVSQIDQSISDTSPVSELDRHQSKIDTQRISREGNPLKDNTVEGRIPEPREGAGLHPPVSRPNAETDSDPHPTKPSQSPIERKAYAMADSLARFHWDNCKVCFVKETARAYAEGALRDGHDQNVIIKAYDVTLRYCHRLTTDEICRGERHQHEKVTPALTVWLARERLKGDPRTVEERWKVVIVKLTVEQRKFIEDEARLRQEIHEKTPEIKAWFATRLNRDLPANRVPMHEMEPLPSHDASPVSPCALSSGHDLPSERFPLGGAATSLPLSVGHTTMRPSNCASSASNIHGKPFPLAADHALNHHNINP